MHNKVSLPYVLSVMNQPEVCSSNLNIVFLPISRFFYKYNIYFKYFHFVRLWSSHSMPMFRNAP